MTIIYTITAWSLSSGTTISSFSERGEWKKEIDNTANDGNRNNTYYSLTASVYEAPEGSTSEIEPIETFDYRGERHKRVSLSIDQTPEDWELVSEENISYFSIQEIWAEKSEDGYLTRLDTESWRDKPEAEEGGEVILAYTDGDEIYETYDEALSVVSPSQYLSI